MDIVDSLKAEREVQRLEASREELVERITCVMKMELVSH